MSRLPAALLAVAGVLALSACGDTNQAVTAPAGIEPSASLVSANGIVRHIMLTRGQAGLARGARPKSGGNTGIFYHGGPVLQSGTSVAAIYWAGSTIYNGGPAVGSTGIGAQDGSLVGTFLRNLGGSPYFNINSTYTDGSGNHIVNAVTYTQFWANDSYNVPSGSQSVSDAQMADMLQYAFNNGKLQYDPNTLYAIFTAGTVNLGGGFGTQYCAYHTHATVTVAGVSRTVLYAAMPYDYAYPSGCTAGYASPNNDPAADAEVNTLAHETEETTTDMLGTAWYDRRGYENADKCAWQWGTTHTTSTGGVYNVTIGGNNYLIQQNWVNAGSGGCLSSY